MEDKCTEVNQCGVSDLIFSFQAVLQTGRAEDPPANVWIALSVTNQRTETRDGALRMCDILLLG